MISVVIPAYNAANFIRETLRSVLVLKCEPIEVIVVDDFSSDATAEVARSFFDERLRIVRHDSNRGVSAARNTGLAAAHGEFIMFLDADDIAISSAWPSLARMLRDKPGIVAAYGRTSLFQGDYSQAVPPLPSNDPKPSGNVLRELVVANSFISVGTILIRRSVLEVVGGFRPDLAYGEDWELWCRLAARGSIEFVDATVHAYRRHASSATGGMSVVGRDRSLDAVEMIFENDDVVRILGKDSFRLKRLAKGWRYFLWGSRLLRKRMLVRAGYYYVLSLTHNPLYFLQTARRIAADLR